MIYTPQHMMHVILRFLLKYYSKMTMNFFQKRFVSYGENTTKHYQQYHAKKITNSGNKNLLAKEFEHTTIRESISVCHYDL